MPDKLEERGLFWRAEQPIPQNAYAASRSVAGSLRIDGEGRSILELDNLLPRLDNANTSPPNEIQGTCTIMGILKVSGSYIRLEGAQVKRVRFNSDSASYQEFQANTCVVSSKPLRRKYTEPFCTSIRMSLTSLEGWIGLQVGTVEATASGLSAKYQTPKLYAYRLKDANLEISAELRETSGDKIISAGLTQHAFLTYTPDTHISLDQVKEMISRIEDFLILLTDCDLSLDQPEIEIEGQNGWQSAHFTHLPRSKEKVSELACWARLPQFETTFGEIFGTWLANHEKLGPAFHLYLGTRRGGRLNIEHRFGNLVWGLESLHRRTTSPVVNPKLDEKIKRILNAVERKDHAWLKRQLGRANEPDLAMRLAEMIASLPIDLNSKEVSTFADRCAKRRNDLSHFGGQREGDGYSAWVLDLHVLSDALDPIYHARILQQIGVPDEHISQIFTNSFSGFGIRNHLNQAGITLASQTAPGG